MKTLYWRPPTVSHRALVLIALCAVTALVVVEAFPVERRQHHFAEKMAAARLARACMEAIKAEKLERGFVIDEEADPAQTGMIGKSITAITSNTGFIEAKLTSTNPNFAAVVVHQLTSVGLAPGDVVAVGVSGSFPALNVSTFAALETLGLEPLSIASASSSEWGANQVDYLWIDMERTLQEAGLIGFRSLAASRGGIDDRGVGITPDGHSLIDAAIERNELEPITPETLTASIDRRMALFDEHAADKAIKAYINVGGGTASVGTHVGKKQFRPGINVAPPRGLDIADSVMLRFARRGVPVIHISRIKLLAERYDLPIAPRTTIPIGRGKVFVAAEYNRWLAAVCLVVLFLVLTALLRLNVAARLLPGRARATAKPAEPMV
ncbi:MAG: poly-gamma-glutamate system protein [Deltaproteobacteria bacterium]|nr:poly-gamma-glutamate system protein [Deltaproteobacteria bacterium]MBW2530510.1 poly-gamma-glutamate system protein [Deltaproteobacteria bacterium]